MSDDATEAIGTLTPAGAGWAARDLFDPGLTRSLAGVLPADAAEGDVVLTGPEATEAPFRDRLARVGTPRAAMYAIAGRHRLRPIYGAAVMREVDHHCADPGVDAPDLEDLEEVPFVTIDGPSTRDLDQAAFIARDGDGFLLRYALADPAHAVAPGSALFDEALRRGATYYLPGLAIPMLPHALSEGVVSLNEGQRRRAVVFDMHIDDAGACTSTTIRRARIRSRAQLTFGGVQRFLDGDAPLGCDEAEDSIRLLRPLGELLMAAARDREVIEYRRQETEVKIDGEEGLTFVVQLGGRTVVERYNEQLSLLCNVEGAKFLREHRNEPLVQAIFRVHPAPEPRRYDELRQMIEALVKRHRLDPSRWRWDPRAQSLGDYLSSLPSDGDHGRLAQAVHRQAVLVNVRSSFSPEAAGHFGVGAEVYARFSAPMREIVGIFLHKEVFEQLRGEPSGPQDDEALREAVVERANEAKQLQKKITKEANLVVLDRVFARDMAAADAPWRRGTVMGLTRSKVHVVLDDPAAVEVKVYLRPLEARLGRDLQRSDDRAALLDGEQELCRLGDAVEIRVIGRDGLRWDLDLRAQRDSDEKPA